MLVFTRKREESIIIGNGIEIRIVRIGREGVRIGITAPPEVPVHRGEIYQLAGSTNASAAESDATRVSSLAARLRAGPRAPSSEPT